MCFVSRVAENKRILSILKETLDTQAERGVSVPAEIADEIDALDIRLRALEATSLRILTEADAGGQVGATAARGPAQQPAPPEQLRAGCG